MRRYEVCESHDVTWTLRQLVIPNKRKIRSEWEWQAPLHILYSAIWRTITEKNKKNIQHESTSKTEKCWHCCCYCLSCCLGGGGWMTLSLSLISCQSQTHWPIITHECGRGQTADTLVSDKHKWDENDFICRTKRYEMIDTFICHSVCTAWYFGNYSHLVLKKYLLFTSLHGICSSI